MKTFAVLSVVAAVALAPSAGAVGAKTVTVSITHSGFVPKAATIAVGDTVSWVNNDTVDHQVVSQAGAFSSPVLKPAQSFSHTFASAGKFPYGDAFVKSFKGTVTVTGAPAPGVTISAASQVVVYGNGTTLSGTVSNQRSGEKVTVFAQQCEQSSFTPVTSVDTTTNGAWTATVKPLKNTVYQAKVRSQTSTQVSVKVRPRLRLAKIAAHRYSLRISAAQSFAGKIAVFQRYAASTGTWVRVRYVTLKTVGTGVAPTVISGATFRSSIKARLRVRAVLGRAMAGSCYLAGTSNVIRS